MDKPPTWYLCSFCCILLFKWLIFHNHKHLQHPSQIYKTRESEKFSFYPCTFQLTPSLPNLIIYLSTWKIHKYMCSCFLRLTARHHIHLYSSCQHYVPDKLLFIFLKIVLFRRCNLLTSWNNLLIGTPQSLKGKESASSAGDLGSIPKLGRSSGGVSGNPLQYSCLENPHGQRSLAS